MFLSCQLCACFEAFYSTRFQTHSLNDFEKLFEAYIAHYFGPSISLALSQTLLSNFELHSLSLDFVYSQDCIRFAFYFSF